MIDHNIFPQFDDDPVWRDVNDFDSASDDCLRWEDDCGYDEAFAGICHKNGSEECGLFCPFHNIHFTEKGE